jgi:N-acetylglucosamine-6-phosphate deacetylase
VTAPYALVGETLTPTGPDRAAVMVRDGRIVDLVRSPRPEALPEDSREFTGLLCPGFIDLQINGAFGADIGPDAEALEILAEQLPSTGVTAFLPTLISSPPDRYEKFFAALEGCAKTPGAQALGSHLEGPFLAQSRKGAHDLAHLRPVDKGFLRHLLDFGNVRVMTLAPELPRALEAIAHLVETRVVASAGHTEATYDDLVRAADAGLSLGTHLYNAMSPLKHRSPGAVGALLTDERVKAGLIVDGVHVHLGALRVAYQAKGSGGLALVTDAMEAAGMRPGVYKLGGREVRLQDGAVRLPDGTLAGSALTMDQAVRNAVRFLGIPLAEAARMASEVPARILSLERKGRISIGCDADFTLVDQEGIVRKTIAAGRVVYDDRSRGTRP